MISYIFNLSRKSNAKLIFAGLFVFEIALRIPGKRLFCFANCGQTDKALPGKCKRSITLAAEAEAN